MKCAVKLRFCKRHLWVGHLPFRHLTCPFLTVRQIIKLYSVFFLCIGKQLFSGLCTIAKGIAIRNFITPPQIINKQERFGGFSQWTLYHNSLAKTRWEMVFVEWPSKWHYVNS